MTTKWTKGMTSPNPNGRPKNSRNASDPATKLRKALDNGWDLKDLKEFAVKLISDPDTKMSEAQIERLLKTLFDVEIKLLQLDFDNNKSSKSTDGDEEQDFPLFKTTAD